MMICLWALLVYFITFINITSSMKKIFLLPIYFVFLSPAFAKKVKFAVDMSGYLIDSMGIHIAGDFQTAAGFAGGNWNTETTKLNKENNTNIYSIVVDIPAAKKYEFRFLNGDKDYQYEFIPWECRAFYQFSDNRWLYVDSLRNDTTFVGAVRFQGNAPMGKKLLRFQVELPSKIALDAKGIHIAGNWQNWKPAETIMYSFDGKIYEYIAYVDSLSTTEYKFINGNRALQYETIVGNCTQNSHRFHTMQEDIILAKVCYAECVVCPPTIATNELGLRQKIHVSPNPFSHSLKIDFQDESPFHDIEISNQLGQVVERITQVFGNQYVLTNHNLPTGIYFLKISNDKKQITTFKLEHSF